MHPAISLVLFTTWSGTGFGLIFWLGLGLGPSGADFAWAALIASALLVGGGLSASVFHLKRPDRAWRAASQWRSSWLSREAVLAITSSGAFGVYGLLWIFGGLRIAPLGLATSLLALVTVYATAMIYAQLRTVPHWHTWLTPLAYIGFSLAGGSLVLAAMDAILARAGTIHPAVMLVTLAFAWTVKLVWWRHAARSGLASAGATREAATGLGAIGTVRPFEPPHTGSNYLLREMVFTVGRRRAGALRRVALVLGAMLPALLVAWSGTMWPGFALSAAAISFLVGVTAERWLFFSQAEHAVQAYYR